MEKTYRQKIHYRVVIEGDYSVCDMWDEDLYQAPEEAHDNVLEHLYENFAEILNSPKFKIELSDLRTEEE
jgi:hypothetical protein